MVYDSRHELESFVEFEKLKTLNLDTRTLVELWGFGRSTVDINTEVDYDEPSTECTPSPPNLATTLPPCLKTFAIRGFPTSVLQSLKDSFLSDYGTHQSRWKYRDASGVLD